jgi:gluconokinase
MQKCIIYIMGVSGSGKTTIGKKLAGKIGLPFFDADDFHSVANKQKMTAGIPLTDEDRQSWLNNMNQACQETVKTFRSCVCVFGTERKIPGCFIIRNCYPTVFGYSSREVLS